MTTLGGVLQALEGLGVGADPDDLAAATCVLLRRAGFIPRVRYRIERKGERLEEQHAVAIEVFEDNRLVASYPIRPIPIGPGDVGPSVALAAIERFGGKGCRAVWVPGALTGGRRTRCVFYADGHTGDHSFKHLEVEAEAAARRLAEDDDDETE